MALKTVVGKDPDIAKNLLLQGEVIGVPTETVYGLAGNALNPDAVLKIFSVKNRPHFDPLIVHVHSSDEIKNYTKSIPAKASALIEHFMPGPLTLLLKKRNLIPDLVTSGLETVAIRVPQHPVITRLLKKLPFPLAAPSANPFGYISPTSARHVYDQLNGKIPYVLDGGPASVGVESTIVGFEGKDVVLYRPGGIPVEAIEKVVGKVKVSPKTSSKIKGPGMLKSHYAPKKKLIYGDAGFIALQIEAQQPKTKFAVITFNQYLDGINSKNQILLSPKGSLTEAARNLFSVMRNLDKGNSSILFGVEFPKTGLGLAINDRLRRAAG